MASPAPALIDWVSKSEKSLSIPSFIPAHIDRIGAFTEYHSKLLLVQINGLSNPIPDFSKYYK
jgi:hypothetical protein